MIIPPHTIFLTVGPIGSGKTSLGKRLKQQFYEKYNKPYLNFVHISSDILRGELLGSDKYHKYDPNMTMVSQEAFDLLFCKLKQHTSYKCPSTFIYLDTTGLNVDFREQVSKLATERGYLLVLLVFDFNDKNDFYYENCDKFLIHKHIHRMRKELYSNKKEFKYFSIKSKEQRDNFKLSDLLKLKDIDFHIKCHGNSDKYFIVGDVHECINELRNLLTKNKLLENDIILLDSNLPQVVFVGDIIDKGSNTKETMDFFINNRNRYIHVLGNHEDHVNNRIQLGKECDIIKYSSFTFFKENPYYADQLNIMCKEAIPFFRLWKQDRHPFIITHSLAENQYLGKLFNKAIKEQVFSSTEATDILDSTDSGLLHIFGHLSCKQVLKHKNKIGLDTGCYQNNKLSALLFDSIKGYKRFVSVPSQTKNEALDERWFHYSTVNLDILDEDQEKRLNYVCNNNINFISGTMCPAPKSDTELESLEKAIEYYRNQGIEKLHFQPKYMGSRGNIYLFSTDEEDFGVSRNGFKINHVDLTNVFKKLHDKHDNWMKEENIRCVVFDGEIIPWRALGKKLIDKQFGVIGESMKSELKILQDKNFIVASKNINEEKSIKILKNTSSLEDKYIVDPQYSQNYNKQLELYGKEEDIDFKPFNILKVIYNDNNEDLYNNYPTSYIYNFISDDINYTFNTKTDSIETAVEYYKDLVGEDNNKEGIVIKPNYYYDLYNIAPFLKVRNPDYLNIIYGPYYKTEKVYNWLINKKNINKKLNTSIKEFQLGNEMLSIPYDQIDKDNTEFKKIVAQLLKLYEKEKEIDPRL